MDTFDQLTGTRINVYDDGKWRRNMQAELLKDEETRVLIRFTDHYSWVHEDPEQITVWFEKSYDGEKGLGVYEHEPTNTWFYKYRETDDYKREMRNLVEQQYIAPEFYKELFGEI